MTSHMIHNYLGGHIFGTIYSPLGAPLDPWESPRLDVHKGWYRLTCVIKQELVGPTLHGNWLGLEGGLKVINNQKFLQNLSDNFFQLRPEMISEKT